jgi:AAA15 family ATPase/GTPase
MGIIIKEIKISDDSYSFISDEKSEKNILKNLSKINIFIGENNSGKSRLLRTMLFKNDDIKSPYFIPNNEDFTIIKESIFHLKEEISKITGKYGIKWENISIGSSNLEEKFSKIDNLDFIKPSDTENSYENKILEFKEFLDSLTKKGGRTRGSIRPGNTVEVSTKAIGIQFKKLYDETFKDIDDERIALTLNYNFSKFIFLF